MKASILDLRRRMRQVLDALERRENVTITYRGQTKAVMYPVTAPSGTKPACVSDHPIFGLWADRDDLADVQHHVRKRREGRTRAL